MDNKKLICYQVGEKYDKVMKTDGAVFEMYDQNGVISISVTNLTEDEIFALDAGQLDIYLSVIEGIIFVVAEFKDKFIFDMPFNYGLYEKFELENPAPYGFTVSVIAVEGIDNTIKAMRVVGLDPESVKSFICSPKNSGGIRFKIMMKGFRACMRDILQKIYSSMQSLKTLFGGVLYESY